MQRQFVRVGFLCVAAMAAFCGSSVYADTILGTSGDFQLSISDPVDVGNGSESLAAVILKATYLPGGSNDQVWPSSFSGSIGIGGQLHHEQFRGGPPLFPRVTTPTATGASNSPVDSHFLLDPRVTVSAPAEPSVDDATSAEPGAFGPDPVNIFTGFGGPLTADVGFFDATNKPSSATLDIARLVGKKGTSTGYNFQIATSTIGLFASFEGTNIVFGGVVPGDTTPPLVELLERDVTLLLNESQLANLQLQATDDTAPISWAGLTYSGPGKSPLFPNAADATVSSTGVFNWNPNGWKEGIHEFRFNVSDGASPANTAEGALALRVDLTVPEPATLSLLGLALVGFVGVARRRG